HLQHWQVDAHNGRWLGMGDGQLQHRNSTPAFHLDLGES
ncbi:unnamed protein product, partial [marine sediment metagenome]